jgi:hypothetical protein
MFKVSFFWATHLSNLLTQVAAKQPKQKDKTEEWILAVVISYNVDKNKYV